MTKSKKIAELRQRLLLLRQNHPMHKELVHRIQYITKQNGKINQKD